MNVANSNYQPFTPVKPTQHLDRPVNDVEKQEDALATAGINRDKTQEKSSKPTFIGELENLGQELRNDDKRHKSIVEDAIRAYTENSTEPLRYPYNTIQNDSPVDLRINSTLGETVSKAHQLASDVLSKPNPTQQDYGVASTAVMMALRSKMAQNHQSREQLFADAIKAYTGV